MISLYSAITQYKRLDLFTYITQQQRSQTGLPVGRSGGLRRLGLTDVGVTEVPDVTSCIFIFVVVVFDIVFTSLEGVLVVFAFYCLLFLLERSNVWSAVCQKVVGRGRDGAHPQGEGRRKEGVGKWN